MDTAAVSESSSAPRLLRGEYQRQHSALTLREGLAEYYRVNPGLSDPATIADDKSATYFRNHDTTHVVFGTHTGKLDEVVNDLLTLFGVEVRFLDYLGGFLATDESASIAKQYADTSAFALLWRALKLVPKVWRRTRAMHKKWPWTPPPELMDRPLAEIRQQYGIEVLRAEVVLGLADDTGA